jgi:hypothetical protein
MKIVRIKMSIILIMPFIIVALIYVILVYQSNFKFSLH